MTNLHQSNHKKAANKHNGIKYVITTVSVISAIGLWNQFATKDQLTKNQNNSTSPDPIINTTQSLDFSPIPTVVPAYQIQTDSFTNTTNEPMQNSLRQVSVPTMTPSDKPQVTIQQVIISNPSSQPSNNTSNNNTFVPPVNQTGSSK